MKRMAFTVLCAVTMLAVACTQDAGRPSAKMERAQAVRADEGARKAESFCDRFFNSEAAPSHGFPPLEDIPSGKIEGVWASGRWTWVNIWATFCVPCVREMPALVKWREQIASSGTPLDLVFVSVDDEAGPVRGFLRKNPAVAPFPSYRAPDHARLEAAIKRLGLGSLDSIPIHILVSPDGRVRCARAGALNDDDFPLIRKIIR